MSLKMYIEICDTLIRIKTLVVVYDSSFKYVSTKLKPARSPHFSCLSTLYSSVYCSHTIYCNYV